MHAQRSVLLAASYYSKVYFSRPPEALGYTIVGEISCVSMRAVRCFLGDAVCFVEDSNTLFYLGIRSPTQNIDGRKSNLILKTCTKKAYINEYATVTLVCVMKSFLCLDNRSSVHLYVVNEPHSLAIKNLGLHTIILSTCNSCYSLAYL